MDYWCALWFWPIAKASILPGRDEWLIQIEGLLDPTFSIADVWRDSEVLRVVADTAVLHKFLGWDLEFANLLSRQGGFDILLGNPPWVKVKWEEGAVLGDLEPIVEVRALSASQRAEARSNALAEATGSQIYLQELQELTGTIAALNSTALYPALQGIQTNLYKCFIERTLDVSGTAGSVGLVYPDGIYDDPNAGTFRKHMYPRLRSHFSFTNELNLFEGVHHYAKFALNTFGKPGDGVLFLHASGILHPNTIDQSLNHDGQGPVPGVKTGNGNWDLRGHRSRVVEVTSPDLALFASLFDPPGTSPTEARLPMIHSREVLRALTRFRQVPIRLGDTADRWFATECFHETNQQHDGTIRRETRAPATPQEWVVSGPHFQVATPFAKTPNPGCSHRLDYSVVDLERIPDDYLPRTNYVPACTPMEYRNRTPKWQGRPVTEMFRHVNRQMIAANNERTAVNAIIPPGPAHIMSVYSLAFEHLEDLALFSGLCSSLPFDFFVKCSGKNHMITDVVQLLPLLTDSPHQARVRARALRLNCLTVHYAPLWEALFNTAFQQDSFTRQDPRLSDWSDLRPTWQRRCALRTPYERRQALVELDALAALALDMTLDELLTIYRVQFPVLQQYERETFYDQCGRIVFTVNRGLPGVGLDRKQWEEVRNAKAGAYLPEFATTFIPPFDRCDREADMADAYEQFLRMPSAS